MKPDEFREMLRVTADQGLLDLCLRADDLPFICRDAISWTAFRQEIARGIDGLVEGDIRIVGSARLGFSMRPRNHLREFTEESDIDVVVVNEALFDWLWIALLVAAYPRLSANRGIGGWDVSGRTELFAGWLTPTAIHMDWKIIGHRGVPLFQFKRKWFDALKLAARPQGGSAKILDDYYEMYEANEDEIPGQAKLKRLFDDTLLAINAIFPDISKIDRWSNRADFYSLFVALGSRLDKLALPKAVIAMRTALEKFATEVSTSLESPTETVSTAARKYARAIEKGSNDIARRSVRHEVLVNLTTPYLKKR